MAALPRASYSIMELALFPRYQDRKAYLAATGQEAPPFDPTRPPKYWLDPDAEKSTKRTVVYENVIAYAENGAPLQGEDGKPMLEALVMIKTDAGRVNIPIGEVANEPGASVPSIPMPLRPLDAEEELGWGFGGTVIVKNRKFLQDEATSFTLRDRELIQAIARKLNVNA